MDGNPFLTEEQKQRYQRQLSIPEIGVDGQIRLGKASVLIVGLGGLGSVSSYYLAAAGVGTLRIVDGDERRLEQSESADSAQHPGSEPPKDRIGR